jgi:hypothetical protein
VSQLSRQCENLNISQPYRPPQPVTGVASLVSFYNGNIFVYFYVILIYVAFYVFYDLLENPGCTILSDIATPKDHGDVVFTPTAAFVRALVRCGSVFHTIQSLHGFWSAVCDGFPVVSFVSYRLKCVF